jgi:hypothetical protein
LGGGQPAGQLGLLAGDLLRQLAVDRGQLVRLGQLGLQGGLGLVGEALLLGLGCLDPGQRSAGRGPLALGVLGHVGLVLPLDLDVLLGRGEPVQDVGLAIGLDLQQRLLDHRVVDVVGVEGVSCVLVGRVGERVDHEALPVGVQGRDPLLGLAHGQRRVGQVLVGLVEAPLGLVEPGLLAGHVGGQLLEGGVQLRRLGLEGVDLQADLTALGPHPGLLGLGAVGVVPRAAGPQGLGIGGRRHEGDDDHADDGHGVSP